MVDIALDSLLEDLPDHGSRKSRSAVDIPLDKREAA
jgi:hypothetical protein